MSNTDNIYNILNNFNKIAKDAPAPVAATPKAKTKLQESMEQVVNEKYMGFKKTVAAIKKSGSAEDPEAVAAAIGRKKYGKEKFQKAAAAGKKLGEGQSVSEEQQDESALQAYIGKKKYGEQGMKALQKAGREGADEEEKGRIKDKYLTKEDHGPENPDAPVNYGEYDREGDMAKDDLYTIDSAAEELYSILQADENLPEWVQSKITKAVDYIDTARDYMKAQSYGQGVAEDQLDEIGNTPAGKAALRAVQNRATDTMDTWSKNSASGYSSTPKQVKKATGAAVSAGNRLHGFGPDRMKQNTVMARDALRKDMAEGAEVDFSAADKVEELVRNYKLFDERGWTDLFSKLAGKKLYGPEYKAEIYRAMEYASKFLQLLDSIRMRSDYRGQQDPIKDQELIDLSNQWLDLFNKATSEYKAMSGQGMAEARFPTVADARKRADQEKGTGKFTSKKNPDHPSGTIYTRKYNPKSGETDDTENVSTEKRGRGRPKKSAFEDMSTIDKMIAESFGELFEGTSRPVGDPVSKAAPTAPGVGSGIRVTPMPALATTPKPAIGMGTIKGGVFTATPPKPGEQGVAIPQGLDEVDAEMEGMRKLAGLKGNDGNLANNAKPYDKVTRRDVIQGAQGKDEMGGKEHDLEEGGRDDYDEIRDKIQWLQGAPNYLSRDEAKETAYYTKDTDPVWDGYRDDADEVGENLEVRANPAGASSAEQAKKIGAQFPQQNGKEPNLAYKIGEDEVEENLIVVPNLSGAGSVAAAKKLGAMMPAKPGEKDPISTNEEDMEEGGAFGLAVTNAKRDGIQPGETFKVGGKEYDLREGDITLNQMRRIAGLKEGGMSPISGMASDMEKQQGSMNISTNQSSDGTKSVTITANGDAASDLMQMLKLAGMSGGGAAPAAAAEPEIVVVAQDGEETMEEEKDPRYQASTTPDEQIAPVQALTKGGNGDVAGQEKTMKPGGYQFGDNNLAMQESLSTQLMKEYNSIKVKK